MSVRLCVCASKFYKSEICIYIIKLHATILPDHSFVPFLQDVMWRLIIFLN